MKTYVKITSSGHPEIIEFSDPQEEYQILSNAVGGLLEMVPSRYPDHFIYLNEEGKLYGLPINDRATSLASGLSPFDMIVGDVVVVGRIDEEGNHESVKQEVVRSLVG